MDATQLVGRVDSILRNNAGIRAPVHVSARIAALVGEAELCGAFGERTDTNSGWAVVFTPTLVCHVTYSESDWDFSMQPDTEQVGESTVTCRVWGRSSLVSIEIECDERRNQDHKWNALWGTHMPPTARIDLRYANGTTIAVKMPRYDQNDEQLELAGMLIRSLASDLA